MPENDQQSGPNVVVLPVGRSLPGTPTDEKVAKQRGKISRDHRQKIFLPINGFCPLGEEGISPESVE